MTASSDTIFDPAGIDPLLAESSALMKRGMSQVSAGPRAAVLDAVALFDAAAALRRQLPLSVPRFRYDLAACYLNRAEACLALQTRDYLDEALRAIDRGLELLTDLPLADDPRFTRRLAVAYQNRGLAQLALARLDSGPRHLAREDFTRAMTVLDRHDAAQPADRDRLWATAAVNLAASLADDGDFDKAADLANRVLALEGTGEYDTAASANLTALARHVLCRRLAHAAGAPDGAIATQSALATDLADDALAVVAHWERAGVSTLRELGGDFFRFGALAYARSQPKFLDEFIAEWLDPRMTSAGFASDPANLASAEQARAAAAAARPIHFTFGDLQHFAK